MENNEIIMNEEIIDVVEDIATGNTYNGVVVLSAGLMTLGAGYLLVKKVVMPAIEKYKAKKEAEQSEVKDVTIKDFEDSAEE